jgi:Domain of unknown function (DUF4388)
VSLEGTLETIALPDVLALLSVTAKTGELRIESGGGVGSVWFDAGLLSGFDVGSHSTAVDALFALLRLKEGHFKFHTGTDIVNAMSPHDVVPVLEEAESRLMQWPAIAAAIPSLYSYLELLGSVDGTVMLRPDQWQLVATIAGGRDVGQILQVRRLGEFDGCRALKELIDMRLVWVSSTAAAPEEELEPEPVVHIATPDLSEAAHEASDWGPVDEVDAVDEVDEVDEVDAVPEVVADYVEVADLSEVWNDETGEVERRVVGEETVLDDPEPPSVADPVNRGLLLKFLGSARN